MEQLSQEWFQAKLGKISGSNMKRVMGGPKAWASYARQLRQEFETLKRIQDGEEIVLGSTFDVAATKWGRQFEPIAIAEYEFMHDVDVKRVGFVVHKDYPFIGCSTDAEVYKNGDVIDGVLEVKCPYSEAVHLKTLAEDRVPDQHRPQLHTEIWVEDVEWGGFISFDPRRTLERRLFLKLLDRDDKYIERMESRCLEFWEFVNSNNTEIDRIKSDSLGTGTMPRLF